MSPLLQWGLVIPSELVTWRCYSVLILGLEFTDSEQHDLNGPDEDASQAAIEDHIEEEDLNCWQKNKHNSLL